MSKHKQSSITNTTGVGLTIAAINSAINIPKNWVDVILYLSPFFSIITGLFFIPYIINNAEIFYIKSSIKKIDWLKKLSTDENTRSFLENERNSIIKNAAKSFGYSQNNEMSELSEKSENNIKSASLDTTDWLDDFPVSVISP